MDTKDWLDAALKLSQNEDVRSVVRRAFALVPAGVLSAAGLGRSSPLGVVAGAVGGFAAGAVAGASLMWWLGPDNDGRRKVAKARLDRIRRTVAERGRDIEHKVQSIARNDAASPFHVPRPDDTLVPRA
jgi:hypothetical protein